MPEHPPVVSVIIPAFNEEKSIGAAIESVLSQTYKEFKLIVVDDGSNDSTPEILDCYAAADSRIRILSKENTGVADSLNQGIAHAKGKYVARLDADDISHPDRLAKQVAFLETHPEIGMVGSWAYVEDRKAGEVLRCMPPVADGEIRKYMQRDNPFIHSSVMIRREVLDKVGRYEAIKGMEDYGLWIRVANNYAIANIPEFLVTRFEKNNFYTKATWGGLTKSNIYAMRLRYQWQAAKSFGPHIKTPWYLGRTLAAMVREKLRSWLPK